MASRRIFGLNLFVFVLVLFLRIEFNSSEQFSRNEKSVILGKDITDPDPRSFFFIDSLRKSKPGNEWQIVEDPADPPRIRRSPGRFKNRKGTLPQGHTRHAPPKTEDITGFPNLNHATPKGPRKRWVDRNTGEIFEWDSEKGELEKYNKRGKHLGSFDPYSGARRGEADSSRSIEV